MKKIILSGVMILFMCNSYAIDDSYFSLAIHALTTTIKTDPYATASFITSGTMLLFCRLQSMVWKAEHTTSQSKYSHEIIDHEINSYNNFANYVALPTFALSSFAFGYCIGKNLN